MNLFIHKMRNITMILLSLAIVVKLCMSCSENTTKQEVKNSNELEQPLKCASMEDRSVLVQKSDDVNSKAKAKYKLVYFLGDLAVEQFDAKIMDENRYNQNNIIYTPKTKIKYSYKYIDNNAKEFLFQNSDLNHDFIWDLIDTEEVDDSTINTVLITVLEGLFKNYNGTPEESQTVIGYEYCNRLGKSGNRWDTGLVENEENVWMHPPRNNFFRILQLNPYPFIKKPYTIGNKWASKLSMDNSRSNKNWKEWDGIIENKCKYEIIDKVNLNTNLGKLVCYKIKSTAKSRIGETSLMAYFNEKYGFVKLDYTNINNTKIILEIADFVKYDSLRDSNRY